jgi:hypothetical protein
VHEQVQDASLVAAEGGQFPAIGKRPHLLPHECSPPRNYHMRCYRSLLALVHCTLTLSHMQEPVISLPNPSALDTHPAKGNT